MELLELFRVERFRFMLESVGFFCEGRISCGASLGFRVVWISKVDKSWPEDYKNKQPKEGIIQQNLGSR